MKKSLIAAALILMPSASIAQNSQTPFYPLGNNPTILSVTTSAGNTPTALLPTELPTWQELCINTGPGTPFVAFGGNALIATTTGGMPLPSGVPMLFTLNEGQEYISALTATSTASVYCMGGRGNAH